MRAFRRAVVGGVVATCLLAANFPAVAGAVPGQGDWESTLLPRDFNNDGQADAFYDVTLNVTWLAQEFGGGNWAAVSAWAVGLTAGGVSGWRLPVIQAPQLGNCSGSFTGGNGCGFNVDTSKSELAHLFYVTLGDKAAYAVNGLPQVGYGLTNTGPFPFLYGAYFTGTATGNGYAAWYFDNATGYQGIWDTNQGLPGIAVHGGDVTAAIPEPSPALLLIAGASALWMRQRQRWRA